MVDRPILFSGPMVRALLAGRKTQTRRVLKPQPIGHVWRYGWSKEGGATFSADDELLSGRIPIWAGDRLWVREAFSYETLDVDRSGFMPPWYWADGNPSSGDFTKPKPSIHMPRWASRLTLTVTDVRVERLQDISEEDALAEGVVDMGRRDGEPYSHCIIPGMPEIRMEHDAIPVYAQLWEHINGPGSWSANPWIVAYSFSVHHGNIDEAKP